LNFENNINIFSTSNIYLMSMHNKSNLPKVAVLLAAFNGARWLKEQVNSILTQKNVEISLFVSVDQSSDETEAIVSALCDQFPQIKALEFGHKFGGAALNFYHLFQKVDLHPFEYIALADQDDIWLPEKLWRAISCISVLKADAYSSNAIAYWDNGNKTSISKAQAQTTWDFLFEAAGPGCTYVFSQSLALQIQNMLIQKAALAEQVWMHDWLFYAFTRSKKLRWFIDEQSLILYRQHSLNQVGANIGMRAFIKRSNKVLSGWALGQSLQIAKTLNLDHLDFINQWKSGSRVAYLHLAKESWQCRRKLRDKFYFFLACLGMFLIGTKIEPLMLEHN
jgi:rhamnosyltransferase